jgi:hypothetical protein
MTTITVIDHGMSLSVLYTIQKACLITLLPWIPTDLYDLDEFP